MAARIVENLIRASAFALSVFLAYSVMRHDVVSRSLAWATARLKAILLLVLAWLIYAPISLLLGYLLVVLRWGQYANKLEPGLQFVEGLVLLGIVVATYLALLGAEE